ncbi:DUF3016 domain-containing protein [Massilia forsythiae]|uniref:DUF3016 domain-containing protein n=1 Tax=Massilia forsythiae TaxID=2728020 RepID=A0A7Z2VUL7_9BURK|nr:DUF3016 domain-containing protein [Massilia forsythiae]QJD99525.1 DUF3016 domain-containing protein [Massilia forsythiae]
MKSFMKDIALAGLLALAAGGASAAVTVTYVHPETFHDLPFATWERDDMLAQVTDHFTKLGKSLPEGQDLRIEVLDFDPAGRLIPNARLGRDLRVLSGSADWPRMDLRYTVEQNGQVIKSGEAKLSDMNYQQGPHHYFDSEPLRYEKEMIDEWFEKTIAPLPRRR